MIRPDKTIILGFVIFSVALLFVNPAFSQEPVPPKIPEPSPEPKPIKIPEPEPIRDPFPEETDTEKIQRLTKENNKLKEENLDLKIQIVELNEAIEKLQAITMEQIKVIVELVEQIKQAIFDKLLESEIKV